MTKSSRRPLLNPVLQFTKNPKPKGVTGGGKSAGSIVRNRLEQQRRTLTKTFQAMAETAINQPNFSGQVVVHATMFEDSLAPSYRPNDLFSWATGANFITPYRRGYLIEVEGCQLEGLATQVEDTARIKEMVDISRVQSTEFFNEKNVRNGREMSALWDAAPEIENGRAFTTWFMPLQNRNAIEHLIQKVAELCEQIISSPPSMLDNIRETLDSSVPAVMRRSLQATANDGDRISLVMRNYRQYGHARATLIIPSQAALGQFLVSGTVFRIDPMRPITSAANNEVGVGPYRPLPANMSDMPIVGVVDGLCQCSR